MCGCVYFVCCRRLCILKAGVRQRESDPLRKAMRRRKIQEVGGRKKKRQIWERWRAWEEGEETAL